MPRVARAVFARVPHHLAQRGNRGEDVFFTDADRQCYLEWLSEYGRLHGLEILAYCLMTNHVHLVGVPAEDDSLQRTLKPLHMRYAQRINRRRRWSGHLWQGRFFSSPLDEDYMWAAICYVERNPVRARIVRKAENYRWSSAAPHCGLRSDDVLSTKPLWVRTLSDVRGWSAWLAEGDEDGELTELRRNIDKGLPCGNARFISKLEKLTNRVLCYRPQGRPRVNKG